MRNLNAVVLLVVGFVSGAASSALFLRGHGDRSVTDIPSRSEQLDSMADEVGLDAAQRAQAHEISGRTHTQLTRVQESAEPQLKAIRDDVRAQLRALMTPAQQVRFDAYCKRRDQQRAHRDD